MHKMLNKYLALLIAFVAAGLGLVLLVTVQPAGG